MKKPVKQTSYTRMKKEVSDLTRLNKNLLEECKRREKILEGYEETIKRMEDEAAKNAPFLEYMNAPIYSLYDMVQFSLLGKGNKT